MTWSAQMALLQPLFLCQAIQHFHLPRSPRRLMRPGSQPDTWTPACGLHVTACTRHPPPPHRCRTFSTAVVTACRKANYTDVRFI
ncbi:hypothetical protein EDB85DRAFT_1981253, partial [Lactarius pseudohatsudake]